MRYNKAESQSLDKFKLEIGIHLNSLRDSNLPLKLPQDLAYYPSDKLSVSILFQIQVQNSAKCNGKAYTGNRED